MDTSTPPAGDWIRQVPPDFRQRIVNKILETFKKHIPISEQEGLLELENKAVKLEEEVFASAVSQSSYLRKISIKLMVMESKYQPPVGDSLQPNRGTSNQNLANIVNPPQPKPSTSNRKLADLVKSPQPNPGTSNQNLADLVEAVPEIFMEVDWRSQLQPDSRQRIVNKIMETLKRHLPFSGQEGLLELRKIAARFEDKIFTAATTQSDYLRKISLKMLTMETKGYAQQTNTGTSSNPNHIYLSHDHNRMMTGS